MATVSVTPEDGGWVCVNCTLIVESGATGCVVLLSALENMQKLLSHNISQDKSGAFARECFPVFSSGNFSIATGINGPLGVSPVHIKTITISEAATTRK